MSGPRAGHPAHRLRAGARAHAGRITRHYSGSGVAARRYARAWPSGLGAVPAGERGRRARDRATAMPVMP